MSPLSWPSIETSSTFSQRSRPPHDATKSSRWRTSNDDNDDGMDVNEEGPAAARSLCRSCQRCRGGGCRRSSFAFIIVPMRAPILPPPPPPPPPPKSASSITPMTRRVVIVVVVFFLVAVVVTVVVAVVVVYQQRPRPATVHTSRRTSNGPHHPRPPASIPTGYAHQLCPPESARRQVRPPICCGAIR